MNFAALQDALDVDAGIGDYEDMLLDWHLENLAEIAAENAWLRAAEYDPEQEAFERWEASMGKQSYEEARDAAYAN